MTLEELETHISIMLKNLQVSFRKVYLMHGNALQFNVEDFGLVICAIDKLDYQQAKSAVDRGFSGYRELYITTDDRLEEKRYEVIWELMKCGYMKYIRVHFNRQFKHLMSMQNFGNRIIDRRLEIWADRPKYRFLIADNEDAKKHPTTYILATEPSFFDYMPEE